MTNYVIIGLLVVALTGAGASAMSILPSRSKNVVPMKEAKSERSIRCKGEVKVDDMGRITECSEGFYLDESASNKEERKASLKEKILNFFANLKGFMFWGTIAMVILAPGLLGTVVGRLFEGAYGVANKALKSSVRAISRAKKNGGQFMAELDRAHSADPKIQKKINELRALIDK